MNAVAGTVTTCMVNARTGATAAMAVYIATWGTRAVVAMNAVAGTVTTCMVNARTGATAAMAVYIATRGTRAVVAMNAVAGTVTTCMVTARTGATAAMAVDHTAKIRTGAVVATNAVPVAGTPVLRIRIRRGRRSAIGTTRTGTRYAVAAKHARLPVQMGGEATIVIPMRVQCSHRSSP